MFDDDVREPRDDGDWVRVLDASSSQAELEQLIAAWTRTAVEDFRAQLEADADFSARDRAVLIERATALLEPLIRADVERAHTRCLPIH